MEQCVTRDLMQSSIWSDSAVPDRLCHLCVRDVARRGYKEKMLWRDVKDHRQERLEDRHQESSLALAMHAIHDTKLPW
jgi:hypothetical protein